MHSSCRIPDVQHNFTGSTARERQLCQGLGELTSRDPAWKIRRKNQVCGRRLVKHLATLSQQCDESTTRINHDIRRIRSLLLSASSSSSFPCRPALARWPSDSEAVRSVSFTSTTSVSSDAKIPGIPGRFCLSFPQSSAFGHARRDYKDNGSRRKIIGNKDKHAACDLNKQDILVLKYQDSLQVSKVSTPRILSTNAHGSCRAAGGETGSISLDSHHQKLVEKPKRWISSARICDYEAVPTHCYHFPWKRPKTYSHIGFRSLYPQLKTMPWVRSGTGSKNNRSELGDTGNLTSSTRRGASAKANADSSCSKKHESLKHRLPSAVRLRPVDTAFREQLLREEADRRRRLHRKLRPADWEINYGKPTPFKRLWYPVRLKPNELVSW